MEGDSCEDEMDADLVSLLDSDSEAEVEVDILSLPKAKAKEALPKKPRPPPKKATKPPPKNTSSDNTKSIVDSSNLVSSDARKPPPKNTLSDKTKNIVDPSNLVSSDEDEPNQDTLLINKDIESLRRELAKSLNSPTTLAKIIHKLDKDKNGDLSKKELMAMVTKMGQYLKIEMNNELIDKLWLSCNPRKYHTGSIDQKSLERWLWHNEEADPDSVSAETGKAVLKMGHQLKQQFKQMNLTDNDDDAFDPMNLVDEDPIDKDIETLRRELAKSLNSPTMLKKIIRKLDKDKSGNLSKKELMVMVLNMGKHLNIDITNKLTARLWISCNPRKHHFGSVDQKSLERWLWHNEEVDPDSVSVDTGKAILTMGHLLKQKVTPHPPISDGDEDMGNKQKSRQNHRQKKPNIKKTRNTKVVPNNYNNKTKESDRIDNRLAEQQRALKRQKQYDDIRKQKIILNTGVDYKHILAEFDTDAQDWLKEHSLERIAPALAAESCFSMDLIADLQMDDLVDMGIESKLIQRKLMRCKPKSVEHHKVDQKKKRQKTKSRRAVKKAAKAAQVKRTMAHVHNVKIDNNLDDLLGDALDGYNSLEEDKSEKESEEATNTRLEKESEEATSTRLERARLESYGKQVMQRVGAKLKKAKCIDLCQKISLRKNPVILSKPKLIKMLKKLSMKEPVLVVQAMAGDNAVTRQMFMKWCGFFGV